MPRHMLGGSGYQAPSDTLNIAGIGVGGRGASNMNALTSENIVAICDIDYDRVDQTLRNDEGNVQEEFKALHQAYEQAERYADYRVMLDEMRDEIDAVVIATPDHFHATVAKRAMEMGKHVYVEKPLTRTVREARALLETAEETNVVTQMGNQGHTHPDGRRAQEEVPVDPVGHRHRPVRAGDALRPPASGPVGPGVDLLHRADGPRPHPLDEIGRAHV